MKTRFTYFTFSLPEFLFLKKWPNIALFLILWLSFASNIQAQTIEWEKTIGGFREDIMGVVRQTRDGGYILGGSSRSNKGSEKSADHKGNYDFWVIKLDATGKKIWDRTIGGRFFDETATLEQTQDGGYIVGGSSSSGRSGDKSENGFGGYDYWLVKLDANGNKVWDKTYGGNSDDVLSAVQQTQDGGYILGGTSDSRKTGVKTQDSKTGCKPGFDDSSGNFNDCPTDYWIVKVDAKGQKEWDKTLGGLEEDHLKAIRQTPDGGYILGGSSNSGQNGDKSQVAYGKQDVCNGDEWVYQPCSYNNDFWIIKVDATGQKVWDKTIGGDSYDDFAALDLTPDGGFILGGTSASNKSGNKSEDSKVYADYWIVKLTADGTVSWDQTIGGTESDALRSLQATQDKGYILGGTSGSNIGLDKSEDYVGWPPADYWVVKLDARGNKVWDETIAGNYKDELSSISQTSNGGYILGGTSSSDKGTDKSEGRRGDYDDTDYWIVKLTENNKRGQTITGTLVPDRTTTAGPFTLTATASSGLPLVYELVSGPAKLQGALVKPTGKGLVTIKAIQPGNNAYLPAPAVIIKININLPVPVTKVWDRTLTPGVFQYDEFKDIITTPDGGYLVGGTTASGIGNDKSEPNRGNDDYWVIKLDANGQKVWDKSFGGANYDFLVSLTAAPDGGYLLSGNSYSGKGGDKSQANKGEQNFWIIKIDANGNKLWDKTFGSLRFDILMDVKATTDDGFLLGGFTGAGRNGDKSQVAKGQSDYWIIKIDANGNKLWDRSYGGSKSDRLYSILPTATGFLLGGSSNSGVSGDKSEHHTKNSNSDFWVVNIDENGNKVWDKTYRVESGTIYDMLPTPDNGFLLGGVGLKTRTSFLDYWVVKIDATGKPLWQKSYDGNYIESMAATPDGNYLLAGDSYDEFTENRSEAAKGGSTDYWLIKIDGEGHKLWDKTLGSIGKEDSPKVVVAPDGGYVVGGTSGHYGINGDKSQVNPGYWIIKIKEDQPTPTAWNMRYGGSGADNLTSTIKTTDGGYLSGGYTNSGTSGDKSQNSQGQNDYWIVKSDRYGKKQWDKRFGGNEDDYLNRVIQTQDGGYLLAGSSLSSKSGDKSETSKGNRDYWLVKTDAQGNKQWDKTYGGSGEEELQKVVQLASGEYVLGGHSNSPGSGDKSQNSQGGTDYWLLKISKNGTIIWDQHYGGALEEKLGSFIQTTEGGFLLGGSSLSGKTGNKSQVSQGASDYWVVRTDKQGKVVWEKTFGGNQADEVYSVGMNSNNNYYIAGTSSSGKSGDKMQESKGGKDYWLVTLDQNGTKLWDKTFGGSKDDELTASTINSQGHYVLAGHSYSDVSGDKTQTSQGESDYWVVTVDEKGNKVQDQRYGGSGREELRTVTPTKDGGLLLAGRSDSGVSGDRTQPSQGSTDYWLVKVAPLTSPMIAARQANSVEEPVSQTAFINLQAYPNPFQDKITVSFSVKTAQPISLEAYDSQGQKVATLFQGKVQAQQKYEVEWQAKTQASGLYFLRLQTQNKTQHQKILLSR